MILISTGAWFGLVQAEKRKWSENTTTAFVRSIKFGHYSRAKISNHNM